MLRLAIAAKTLVARSRARGPGPIYRKMVKKALSLSVRAGVRPFVDALLTR